MAILNKKRTVKFDGHTYKVERLIAQGGSGEVYLAKEGDRPFALKLFFPYYQLQLIPATQAARSLPEMIDLQRREYVFLSRLSHPNILRVHHVGDILLQQSERNRLRVPDVAELPALLSDFIDGPELREAITTFGLQPEDVVHILRRVALALQYLHDDRKYLHTDIKSANILVRKIDREPILIDFALCKNLNFAEVDANGRTCLLGDWDLFPKELPTDHRLKLLKETAGPRKDLKELAFPALDLFQVGKLLGFLMSDLQKIFDEREFRYLRTLREQLTDWNVVCQMGPRDLLPRITRLAPEHFTAFGVPELMAPGTAERMIMIPPGVGVPITRRMQRIIETRSWRRLSLINQLCLLSIAYPGADYKRSVHILFAYDLARQLLVALYGSPLFRALFDRPASQQLLAVVLLHDINHFPFLHIFQESQIPGLSKIEILNLFCDGEATGEAAAHAPSVYELLDDLGMPAERFRRLMFDSYTDQQSDVDCVIKSIIDSGVDVDKLSYLYLDGYFTGVRYGTSIDYPCILKAATIGRESSNRRPHLAFYDRGIQALENVVMTRFWNFRSLYWHHTNRALMAMLLRVVRRIYVQGRRDFREYLLATRWLGDIEVLRYISRTFEEQTGRPSILKGLPEERSALFRRLYTVRAGLADESDNEIHRQCRDLTVDQELALAGKIGQRLSDLVGTRDAPIEEDDVLVDVPRRNMDSGGAVYVVAGGDVTVQLGDISEPVRSISKNYERLTKRIRLFVSPRVADSLTKKFGERFREDKRAELRSLISDALREVAGGSQVR